MVSSASNNFEDIDDEEDKSSDPLVIQPIRTPQNPLDILLKAYTRRLETRPVITKAITCSVISALGALVGTVGSSSSSSKKRTNRQAMTSLQKLSELCAFALYGGLVGGPLAHYWNQWLENNDHVNIQSTSSRGLLVDQLIAQPPMLFLMHLAMDMFGAAVQELPKAWSRSIPRTGRSLVSSWRFWPAAVYIILYLAKKKRHATIAMQVAGVYWMSKVAKHRAETQPLSSTVR